MKFISRPRVAHVGTMDRESKNAGSLEGTGLSVSIHPIAWARIHRIGDSGFILEGCGRFLDAMKMSPQEVDDVMAWGMDEGLVVEAEVHVMSYQDDELDAVVSAEFATFEEAEEEAEAYEDATIISMSSTVATAKLAELTHQNPDRLGPDQLSRSTQVDLVLSLWAEKMLAVDGVWWNERLDPERYSAPRGMIFQSKVQAWTAVPADFNALCAFQNSDGRSHRPR